MEIYCAIKNINDSSFSHVNIVKFRQVLFINENRDELEIYTALLVGSTNHDGIPVQLRSNFILNMEFEFSDEAINLKDIKTKNLSDDFFKEINKIKKLWGENCQEIESQSRIEEILKQSMPGENIKSEEIEIRNYKYFLAQKSENDTPIIACSGHINELVDQDKRGYQISIGDKKTLHKGVNLLTWVKTTFYLSGKLSPKENVTVQYSFPNKSSLNVEYLSLYMCPPEGYHILDNSRVDFCLSDKSKNDDLDNNLVKVTHNLDIYYKEWIERHNIENRKIYRLNKEKIFKSKGKELECEKLTITFSITPDTEKGSLQFVAGAIFSAAITYGIDAGRLSGIEKCFWPIPPADIQWFFVCMLSFYSFVKWCSRKTKVKPGRIDFFAKVCYHLGMGITMIWIVVSFVCLRLNLSVISGFYASMPWNIVPTIKVIGNVFLICFLIIARFITPNNYMKKPISRDLFF